MPLFNYRCTICGVVDEFLHDRDTDMTGVPCTRNYQEAESSKVVCAGFMKKLVSAVPFTFNTGPVIKDVIHHDK